MSDLNDNLKQYLNYANNLSIDLQNFIQKIYFSQSDLPIDFFIQLENSIKKTNIKYE